MYLCNVQGSRMDDANTWNVCPAWKVSSAKHAPATNAPMSDPYAPCTFVSVSWYRRTTPIDCTERRAALHQGWIWSILVKKPKGQIMSSEEGGIGCSEKDAEYLKYLLCAHSEIRILKGQERTKIRGILWTQTDQYLTSKSWIQAVNTGSVPSPIAVHGDFATVFNDTGAIPLEFSL